MFAISAHHGGGLGPGMEQSLKTGMVLSFLFHFVLLAGVPLFLYLSQRMVRFERPPTFQLVTAPPSLRPLTPLTARKLSKPAPQVKEKKGAVKPSPSENEKTAEDLNELASLLDEIPAPARITPVGDFKYNWYLANVQQKLASNWNPPSENKNINVVVSFTIFSDGSISEPRITKGSGSSTLDNLALRAVTLSAPFVKLPPGFSHDRLELTCTLIPTRS